MTANRPAKEQPRPRELLELSKPLEPIEKGEWNVRQAAHLLRRTQFGASHAEIQRALKIGLEGTLGDLLETREESPPFRSTESLLRRIALDTGSIGNLKAWWLYRMTYSANSLVEKTTLLWHGHFATSNAKVQSVEHMLAQNELIRRHALGSFRPLLHGMSRDVAMLIWLDGNDNRKRQPNENFAREVMELFSLGVGNYTEKDIAQAARAFTGWHLRDEKFWFNERQHDAGVKNFLDRSGEFDGNDVIDICLEQPACARFLAYKLLTFFVTPRASADQIEALAVRIRARNYDMKETLRELLSSRLFYSEASRHSIIKSPLDLVLGSHRALETRMNLEESARLLAELGQDVFEPPTVKGWDGGRLWITSASMLQRDNFAAELSTGDRYGSIADSVSRSEAPHLKDQETIVRHYVELLLSRDLDPVVMRRLSDYVRKAEGSRSARIRGLIHLIMTMPEYQLS